VRESGRHERREAIRIFLADGEPTGILVALANPTVVA
jgi:hypothetical protein